MTLQIKKGLNSSWSAATCLGLMVTLLLASFPIITQAAISPDQGDNSQVLTDALKKLKSDDKSEREAGRKILLDAGQTAVPLLMEVLASLIPKGEDCPEGSGLPCSTQMRVVSSPKALYRERVISILTELRVVAILPHLIRMLGIYDDEGFGSNYWGPEMSALLKFGPSAVPILLDTLKKAEEVRHNLQLSGGRAISYLRIEPRILNLLGRIGDERALEVFDKLKEPDPGEAFQREMKYAEDKIKAKRQPKQK